MSFLSVEECVATLLDAANRVERPVIEFVDLLAARNRVLATDVVATVDVPPADNSAMDGYAVRHSDLNTSDKTTLTVSQIIHAGVQVSPLEAGTAARIFTGAEIPQGADTVIMQENCQALDDKAQVNIIHSAEKGKNIRRQGQDIQKGSVILRQGHVLKAADIGLLASIGIAKVETFKPLTIALVNTGDELVEPGQPLQAGQIYNSNRFLLATMLESWGFNIEHSHIVGDSLDSTVQQLSKLSKNADVIISTGGVSVGDKDFIKPAIEALGELDVWKVAIKPGKPFAFGSINASNNNKSIPFLGLPGNPSSVFVTLLVLARAYLLAIQGLSQQSIQKRQQPITATAQFARKSIKREEYLRARLSTKIVDGRLTNIVSLFENQSSGVLSSVSWGNCLVRQEVGTAIEKGDSVEVLPY
jgi:molybdopterin molybdotransferase